jgi:hypothetical protein
MTLINCIAGAVYTKALVLREKVQLYGMALIFLVLLYNSPAGLVLYWTMNNVFSLIKNCLQKIKNSGKLVYFFTCGCVLFLDIYVLFIRSGVLRKRILLAVLCSMLLLLPVFAKVKKWVGKRVNKNTVLQKTALWQDRAFIFSSIILFILAGFIIPGGLIVSSVQEFSFIEAYTTPVPFIGITVLQAAGIFLFWPICIYCLFPRRIRIWLTVLISFFTVMALVNTFVFPGDYGFLTPMLKFSGTVKTSFALALFNGFLVCAMMGAVLFLLLSKKKSIVYSLQIVTIISFITIGLMNIMKIHQEYSEFESRGSAVNDEIPEKLYSFSKNGKNILIIMLDSGMSGFIPYVLEEKPELADVFSGVTYYPNCVSFGSRTILGAPPLFGGYEYTPGEMQKRENEPMVKKHNEALLLLPKIFSENAYSVTVSDPPYANYSFVPDLRIYDEYPGVQAKNTWGLYSHRWLLNHDDMHFISVSMLLEKNLIRFSLFKFTPPAFRDIVYDGGKWLNTASAMANDNLSKSTIDQYAALDILPEITKIRDDSVNTLTLLNNELAHESAFFQAPDYVPAAGITDKGNGPFAEEKDYHTNIASLLLLGKWFSFLKDNNVYDNTRIVVVSDHGKDSFGKFPDAVVLPNGAYLETYNALLLKKDFDAGGGFVTDKKFMTTADVPLMAIDGIIDNPVNPFTNIPLQRGKENGATITSSSIWDPTQHGKYTFKIKKDEWLHVKDNIFDPNNWKKAE